MEENENGQSNSRRSAWTRLALSMFIGLLLGVSGGVASGLVVIYVNSNRIDNLEKDVARIDKVDAEQTKHVNMLMNRHEDRLHSKPR